LTRARIASFDAPMKTSLATVALVSSLLSACGADAPKTSADAPKVAPADAGVTPAGRDVELLSAGDEPRRPLRYVFHAGQHEAARMDMQMTMGMVTEGTRREPQTLPVMRMIMEIDPKAITPEGDLQYEAKLTSADVVLEKELEKGAAKSAENPMYEKLHTEFQKLVGLGGSATVSTRGATREAVLIAPPNATPMVTELLDNLRDVLKDLATPLPREAVGRGARWKSVVEMNMKMMHSTRTTSYTLTSLDGDHGTLDMTVELVAPQQPIKNDKLPPNATMTLESLTATGHGTVAFDLQHLVPKSRMTVESVMSSTIEVDAKKTPLTVTTKMAVTIEPAKR
jgi:hypothetical protein